MTQPVQILYAVPVGAIIAWYPPPNPKLPPNFVCCDGALIDDGDSPYHGMPAPDLTSRFVLGTTVASTAVPVNTPYGKTALNIAGMTVPTGSTTATSDDNRLNDIICRNQPNPGEWRYVLTYDSDQLHDGNHHHTVTVPAPGSLALVYIMRIK